MKKRNSLKIDKSLELLKKARKMIPDATQTGSKKPEAFAPGAFPIYIEQAEGCHVWDPDGNKYIDYISALGPISLGYCYKPVDDAVRRQLNNGVVFGLMHPLEVEVAEKIIEVVPCAEMVRFLKTGAEGTAAAARIARGYTGKEIILSQGYHGWLDTWQVGSNGVPEDYKNSLIRFGFNDIDRLKKLLEENRGEVAGIIIMPPYSDLPEKGYMEQVRELADQYGALLIYDEIVTGFRLNLGGAQKHWGVIPDIGIFAKGIANGYPLACVAGKKEVMKAVENLVISSTFGGETLSLAAASAAIDEYRNKDVIPHLWKLGKKLTNGINKAAGEIGFNFKCVGYPPMTSMKIHDGEPSERSKLWTLFLQENAKRGILMRRGGLNFITYSHTEDEIERTIDVCKESIQILKEACESKRDISEFLEGEEGEKRFIPS